MGRVGGLLAAGDGCECSAGVRAGLGFEQCTAGWIEAFEEFLMATGVDGGGRLVLPSLPDVGSVVGVLRWCWWSGLREGYPFRWFPSMCCQWQLGGLVRLGSEVVGGGSPRWWALVAGGRGWHLPRMPNGRLVLEARLR